MQGNLAISFEKEMATHSSVLAWSIPGMGKPGGLPSLGSHRVRHDWNDLAAAVKRSCCCSVAQLNPTLCNPMDCGTPGFPVLHYLPELPQTHVHWFGDTIQPSHHLLPPSNLLVSVFPSIRVFSNESALCIRWPKYWSFSFSISPSNEYSGLIYFRTDCFDLLYLRDSQESSPAPQFESINSLVLSLLYGSNHISTWLLEKP